MQKAFEPNKTKSINYTGIFRAHICETLKRPQEWNKVEPTFAEMDRIRSGFDWQQITKSEQSNQPIMRSLQDNMEEYIRYILDNLECAYSSARDLSLEERVLILFEDSHLTGKWHGLSKRSKLQV